MRSSWNPEHPQANGFAESIRLSLRPIIGFKVEIRCGSSFLCGRSVEKYVLGSGKRLEIEVEVQNEGEDAFESSFELQVPTGLNYVKIERKDESEREIPVQCSPPSFGNNFTLRCDIGNPLPRDKLVKFSVLLQPYQQKTMTPTYEFSMSVNSTNPEKNRTVSDNLVVFRVPIWVVTELAISGSSRPVDVYFNSSQYVVDESETEITKESEIGPQVAHLYTITNKGPSEFLKARATILWPSNTLTGDPLLYLLEPPETSGNVECFVEYDEYNVRKLKIDRKGKSFFDAELGETGALSSSSSHESSSSSSSSGGTGSTYTSKSSSSSSWSSSSKSGGSRVELTREERLKFEEDERRREEEAIAHETGDGSHRHIERAKARAKDSQHYSQNGGRLESDSYSHGSETTLRERGRTETSRNPSVNSKTYEEEMYSRHSSSNSQSGNTGPVTKSRSSERKSSTTWGRDGTGKTVSSWREEEDGVVRNGSTVVEHGGETRRRGGNRHGGVIQRTHERNSTRTSTSRGSGTSGIGYTDSFERDGSTRTSGSAATSTSYDRRNNWRAEGEGMTRNKDGTIVTDEATLDFESRGSSASGDGSSRRGHGSGGSRSSSEERRSEWNTTWTSGGRPVTSEHSSWKVEQDGKTVGSGANRRTYEGTADASKTELESRLKEQLDRRIGLTTHSTSSSNAELDHNLIGVGDTKYTKEWEEQYNTTSGSSTGGKPITVAKTKWRIEENGDVRTGGDTKTYEGVPPGFDNTRITVPSSESTRHQGGAASSHGAGGSFESRHESSSHHESRTHSSRGGAVASGGSEEGSFDTDRDGSRRRVATGVTGIGRSSIIRTTEVKEEEERRTSGRGGSHHGHAEGTIHGEDDLHANRGGYNGATVVETSRTVTTQGGSERRRGHHFSTADEGDDDSRTVEERRRLAETERRRIHGSAVAGEASAEESEDRRSHHVRTESSHSQAEGGARGHHRGSIARTESEHERRTRLHGSSDTVGSDESSRREEEAHRRRGSSFGDAETERRQYGHGESHTHGSERRTSYGSGTSNAASSVGHSSGASSSFDWGAVARGPGDGKARTYVSDLGILSGGSERSGSSAGSASSGGSTAGISSSYGGHSGTHHSAGAGADEASRHHSSSSRERHYSFESGSGTREGSSDDLSGRTAEFAGGSRSRTSTGGSETRYSSSRTHSSAERNFEGDPDLDPDYESRRAGSSLSSSSSHSSSRSYSSRGGSSYGTAEEGSSDGHRSITNPDDRQGFRHYRRERRYADEYDNYGYDEYEEEDGGQAKRCPGPVRCTRIICDIGALKKDQEVHVAVRSRLWVATIKKIAPHVETLVGSEMTAKVTLLPTIGRPSSKTMTKNSTEVKTRIMVEPVATPDVVPLWIVVLSAVSGALILMLLVYVLYKLGFFKRNRPEPASAGSEKTPLNRNGHYQGDEHL